MPQVHTSPFPDFLIPRRSIFTHVFSEDHDQQLPAYIDATTGKIFTRADVHSQSLQLAWSLSKTLGQKKGSTMAIFSPNSLWWPVVLLGGIATGLVVTTINSGYTPPELVHHLKDSQACLIFVHPSLLDGIIQALKMTGASDAEIYNRVILAGSVAPGTYKGMDGWRRVEQFLGKGELDQEVPFDGDETALLCYSSGTTSFPKGVELTHLNIVSNLCIIRRIFHHMHPHGPVMLGVLPFYHIFGLVTSVFASLFFGAPLAIMSRFDPGDFCANIERYKVTFAIVVPPILVVLANHPAPEKYDIRTLKRLLAGAAPLGQNLVQRLSTRFRSLGANVIFAQGYGLTETSPCTHLLDDEHCESKIGSIGALLPNVRARLVLDDGVTEAGVGEPGELWIQGPNVMKGYLNNLKATGEALTPDGWFMTGDIATVDKDGYFKIVDRKKELIKYKGVQVPPAELENILLTHPDVADVGVIGIWSDAEATEYPRAYIVPRGGAQSLDTPKEIERFSQEIQAWVKDKAARYKYLRGGVVITNVIPKSAAGKILRRELRDWAKKDMPVVGSVIAT